MRVDPLLRLTLCYAGSEGRLCWVNCCVYDVVIIHMTPSTWTAVSVVLAALLAPALLTHCPLSWPQWQMWGVRSHSNIHGMSPIDRSEVYIYDNSEGFRWQHCLQRARWSAVSNGDT